MIIVYSKHKCSGCAQVKFALGAAGVAFEERNIEESDVYRAEFDAYGYTSAPVTVFPSGKVVAGFEFGEFARELGL